MTTQDQQNIPVGYKQTEVGIIPTDWNIIRLGDVIKLKNGYAFSSEYFGENGPIIITPGNFKIEGGLDFNKSHTLRYNGLYSSEMCFQKGDLLMVMTDLTPSCNLLGKSGIFNSNETVLHNQRIGKLTIQSKKVDKCFLVVYFNSFLYSKRMKSTATGSTVRHTSVPTINNTLLSFPPLAEQTRIATSLSDMDELIAQLDELIEKKKAIKQGAMQGLLKPKNNWKTKKLGEICGRITTGKLDANAMVDHGKYLFFTCSKTIYRTNTFSFEGKALLIAGNGEVGEIKYYEGKFDAYQRTYVLLNFIVDELFLFYLLKLYLPNRVKEETNQGAMPFIKLSTLTDMEISVPESKEEQIHIVTILSNMDNEIKELEQKKAKYELIKQGAMQQLLTGKIRLK